MSFYALSALINAIASLLLAVFVIIKKKNDPVHITFAIFSLLVFWWSVGYFFWQYAVTPEDALFAVRTFMTGSIFISTAFLHFVLTFVGKAARYWRWIILSYAIFFLFLISDFTPLFVSGVTQRMSFPFWPVPGPLFYLFFVVWTGQVAIVLSVLYKAYKNSSGIERTQLLYILVGTALGFLGGSTNHFLWFGIPIPPIGNILVTSYVVAVAIAILKYELFNIKTILVESAILLLNISLFLNIFTSHTQFDYVLNISGFAVFFVFSVYLIRGIYNGIHDCEKIEELVWEKAMANDRLRMMEVQKAEFVSIASHQLRTPITIIKGYASMILEGTLGKINEPAQEAMNKLFASSAKVVTLVDDLLTVSRIEQGRFAIDLERVDLENLVQETLSEIQAIADEGKVDVSFRAEGGNNFVVAVDAKKFKRALRHILENAVKYTPPSGAVYVVIMDDTVTHRVRLVVTDTGAGMTHRQIVDLMRSVKLENVEDVDKEDVAQENVESKSVGFGLYIAKEIINAHRGVFSVKSEGLNSGTTVVVEIPKEHQEIVYEKNIHKGIL